MFFGVIWILCKKQSITLSKSAILVQSKKERIDNFYLGHFTYTSIHLLEFMIGSSCSLILLNHTFKWSVRQSRSRSVVYVVVSTCKQSFWLSGKRQGHWSLTFFEDRDRPCDRPKTEWNRTNPRPITLKWKIWSLSVSIEIACCCLYTKFEPFSYCKKSGDSPLKSGPVGASSLG